MPTIVWQDGFEGAENLATVYGAGNVDPGTVIHTGQGRNGGNALFASGTGIKNIATTIAAATDPVQIGFAHDAQISAQPVVTFYDATGAIATLYTDALNNVAVTLWTLAGVPTLRSSVYPPRLNSMWRYLEWYFVADPVFGRVAAAVDGDTVMDVSASTASLARGPTTLTVTGQTMDDLYVARGDAAPSFYGDYVVTGTAPAASGSVPSKTDVRVDQQFITYTNIAPKQDVRVDQQYIIVVIKNKQPATIRPQVVGNGRV